MTTIPDRIREALRAKGLNKGDFYRYAGIRSQSLINWELRKSIPAADTAIKMAEYLGVSVKWLIMGIEDNYSREEINLINQYRLLEQKDRDEILGIIQLKLSQKKGDWLYGQETA